MRSTLLALITTVLLFVLAVTPSNIFAQTTPVSEIDRSELKFFTVDHSVFRYDDTRCQLEVYALIDRSYLKTEPERNGLQARYEITFQVLDGDSLLIGDSWVRTDWSESDSTREYGQKIPELVKYMIVPGEYRLAVRVVDLVNNSYFVEEYSIDVRSFAQDSVEISDILMASRIEKSDGNAAEFEHNGLLVLPNAERMFGTSNPQIFYYVEIYNLTVNDTATYWVDRAIMDDRGAVLRRFDRRVRDVPGSDVVDVDAFSTATLRTGVYTLRVVATDIATGTQSTADRAFWVYRPEEDVSFVPRVDPGFDVDAMTDEEVDNELNAIRYLLNDRVRKATKELDGFRAKRAFLVQFWVANDPDSTTTVNEFRSEYLRRLRIANDRYGSLQREGWSTDRGRILLLHGEPDYIDDHPFDGTTNGAWQLWEFHQIEGGVIYVFVDRNNLGDYTQVHSTKKGEMNNPYWYEIEFSR
jgi:GWxTD domain-containing protein